MIFFYYIVYSFLYLISLLPLKILYVISDCFYFLIAYVFKYRKAIITKNIQQAFPEKSNLEIEQITKKFYRNFTDHFIEVIKLISASKKYILNHYSADDSMVNKFVAENKKVYAILGHQFNWELACVATPLRVSTQMLTVYFPLTNKIMDKLFLHLRSKTLGILLPAPTLNRELIKFRNKNYLLILVGDQNPSNHRNSFWINFLNKPAPFYKGPEKLIRNTNMPILYCSIKKIKRGYYQQTLQLISDTPENVQPGELMNKFVRMLEATIREQPDNYLWSHRRWKHDWQPEYGEVLN